MSSAKRLKKTFKSLGINRKIIGEKIGLTRTTISRHLNNPKSDKYLLIYKMLLRNIILERRVIKLREKCKMYEDHINNEADLGPGE